MSAAPEILKYIRTLHKHLQIVECAYGKSVYWFERRGAERNKYPVEAGLQFTRNSSGFGAKPQYRRYEVRMNSVDGVYDPHKAKQKSRVARRSRRCHWRKIEHNSGLRTFIVEKLSPPNHWSPDSIAGYLKREQSVLPTVGKDQIYSWLYSAYGQPYCQHLLSQRYKPKRRGKNRTERVMIPDRASTTERPQAVEDRQQAGHWEGDTVVSGKRTHGKAALAVAQERTTRLIGATLIPDLKPESFTNATTALLTDKKVLSLTLDNSIENKQHSSITNRVGTRVPTFFCDPYSSWQKGGVEHANKMLRRYSHSKTKWPIPVISC